MTETQRNPLAENFNAVSLIKFAFPSMVMMLFMGLYTIVDTIFVARFVDTNALSSINIVCPVINVIVGLGTMLGAGGSAVVAKKMGSGKTEEARSNFTLIIITGIITGLVITIIGLLFLDEIVWGLGASVQRFQKQNIPLFIISNGPAAGQKRRLEKAGMLPYFLDVYTSQDFGAAKPDPAFFDRAMNACSQTLQTKLKPEEILVIGDSWKADIAGALAFGAPSIWLRTNRQHDPFEKPEHENVLEAGSWKDILQLLNLTEEKQKKSSVSVAETDGTASEKHKVIK